jgi:hypothetical protein
MIGKEVGADIPLMDVGLDSLGSVELRNALSKTVGTDLPGTLVFDYPSVLALAGYFMSRVVRVYVEADEEDSVYSLEHEHLHYMPGEELIPVMICSCLCNGSAGSAAVHVDMMGSLDGISAVPFVRWDVEMDNGIVKAAGKQQVR